MERKENDLMLNIVANPDFTLADFASVGLSIDNTSLQSMEQYKSHPLIQEKFSDEYGNFNNHAFTQAYNQALVGYQQLADDSYDKEFSNFISFHRDNIFVSPERRREGPDFIQIEAPNPDKITSSLIKLGELGERTKSASELAQSELVLLNPKEVEQGAEAIWGDAPEDNFLGYFDDTLVLAQYDEDVINEETGEIEHKKGERKIGPNGTYYYEKLDGRDVYGRQVLNKMDVFTKEGSWANQYDFFDSDDINQKSTFGSTMKNLALVGSMFIPYVGPWVAGISLATQLTGLMGTLGKISSLGDVEFMNELEGWSKSVSRSGSTSEYAQNNMWCVENFINLFGDVAGQLKEQRFIFEKIPAIFKGKSIGTKAQQEKLLKSFNDKRLKEADAKIDAIKDSAKKLEYGPALRVEASLKAQADLDSFVKGYNKIGEILSKGYMTTLVTADTYNEAINAGATQAEAVLLTLGYAAGEYALLSSPLGEWILPELKTNAIRNKAIVKALTRVDDEVEKITKFSKGALKRADGETKRQYAKRLIKIGKQAAEEAHHAYATTGKAFGKGLAKATVGGAAAEAGEEVSEELLADVAKGFYNTYQWLTGGESRMSAFGFQWDEGVRTWDGKQVFDRYTMSLLGGGVGGGFANIGNNYRISKDYANMSSTRAMQELVYIGRNEGFKQFRKDLDKAIVGNKYKSANYIESNGLYINPPGTKKDNQDAFVKGVFNKQLDFIEELLNANGAKSDEDFLDVQTLKDLRFHQLQNSVTAGRYLQEYNSLMSKIGHTVDTINKIKSASTDVNDNQTIEDAESRTSGLTQTQEIQVKALEEELKGYQEALKDLNEGKRADEFISDAMFEMNTYLQQTLDFITLPTFVKKKYGKSIQDLDDNELNEAREEFKQFKIDNYDEIASASKIFRDVIQQTSDVIKNSENVYGQESVENFINNLNTLFNKFDLNLGKLESSEIYDMVKGLVDTDALVQLASGIIYPSEETEEEIEETKEEETEDNASQLTEEEIQKQRVLKEQEILKKKEQFSGELLDFIDNIVTESEKAGGINPEIKQIIKKPLMSILGFYSNNFDIFENKNPGLENPYNDRFLQTVKVQQKLYSLGNTPIYDSLNDFIISLDKDPINITELITKLNTELWSKSESITEFNIQNLEFEVESALKSIQLYKAAIMAARTDASNLNNLYGYNVTLNEVSRKIAERDGKKFDESSQLAQIDSKYADMIIQDLEIVENKIRFAYQIHSLNQGQKLSKQDRVSVNFSRLVFSKAKHLITVPDDHPIKKWEGYLEFESAIKAQSKLVEIDSTNDITLNEETKTQIERERFAVEDAMFDFFNKNTDKLKDPEELSKLIGVFDLFTESNELLTDDLGELDGPSFIWYLAGRAAIKSSAFYSELKTVLGDDLRIAPIATQELAVFNNYANIMNGDVFEAFFNAYRLNVRKKWNTLDIDSRKKILKEFEVDEKFADDKYKQWVFNFIPTVKYKNIVLTEGIPGSGKTVAVLDLTKRLLEKNHPEILANTMVLHGADKAGKAEGATRVLNALGVNGTAHDRESGMKVICPTYKPTNISQKGQVIPESEYTFNADKEIVSNLQVSKTDPPSLIVIDEVTNFSDLELGLIDKYAQTHGITVLVVGDYDQIGVTGTQVIKMSGKKENINSASERNNFIRTPKLGVSMRTDNTLKARNQAVVQTILRNKEYQPVTLWYEENENGLFGDKVVYNSDINLVLKEIDKLLETLSDEKIGFIYTDPKSPLYQKLSTDLKYKDKFDFKQDGTAQGSEGQYYIIDTNSATTSTNKVDLEWKQQVYTGLSRASQGSLIITYNPDILNSIPSKQTDSSLSKRSIEEYLINRKKRLDEIITVDEKVTKVERKKLGVTTPTPAPAPVPPPAPPTPAPAPAPAPAPTPSTPEPEPGTIPTPEPEPELKSLPEPGPDVTIPVSPAMGPGVSVGPEPAPKLDPVYYEIKEEPKTDPSSAPINGPSLPENEVVQLSLDFGIDESPENNFNPDSQPEDEINPTVFQNNEHEQLILEMSADDALENSATIQENNNNKVHIDALCYSFNTFELGVTYDSAGNITSDPNYMAQRIDSINGLIKVDQITGDTSMTTKDDYILRLGRLRSILLNEGDPHKLCEKLSDELGIQGININFAIKNSPIPTDGSQKVGQEYFYKPNPYALGASEKLLYVNSLGSRSDKVPPRKIVARIGTSEHGEFLEIPLITLPSPFTLAFLQDGNGTDLFPELKTILLNHRGPDGNYVVDKYTILSEMLEESKKHSKYQEMTDLLTLYTFSYGGIFRIPKPKGSDQIWTLAKDMVNKGQQIVIEAGKNYDPDAELTTDYNALSPNEWIPVSTFSSDPSRSMTSKIYKSKTGMFGEDVKLCNPGHCFILISGDPDLYSDKLKIEQYIKQKTGESTENKVSLYYVLPPTLTIEEYITDLETLLYKPKAKSKSSATHNLHTSYNVLSVLTKSQKFRDVFEAQMPGLLEKIDPLIQRLDELKGNSHAQAEILETKTSWGSKEVPLNTLFNHVLTSFAYNKTSPSQLFNNKGYELDQDLIDLMQEVFDEQGYQLYHNVEIDYDAEPIGPFIPAFQEKDYMFNGKPFLIHGKIDPYVFQGDISNFVHSATLKMKTTTKDGHTYKYSLDKPYRPKNANANTNTNTESDVVVESYWYKEYNKLKAKLIDRFPGWELADVDVNFSSENYQTMLNNLCDAINISGNSVLAMVVENDILISSPNPIFKNSKSITLPEEIRVGDNFDIEIFQDGKYNYYNVTVNEGSLDIVIVPEQELTPDTKTVEPSDPFIPLKITPSNSKDKKAKDKGNMCNKYIGFAEGIPNSATYKYGVQAGSQANTGKYDSSDVIFVSILGNRGDKKVREQQQKLTINEAIKAIEAGATIITDSKEYTFDPSNTYNSGEKLLFNELLKRGYVYQTITAGSSKVGQWKKYDPSAPLIIASDPNVETETQIQPEVQVESPIDLTEQAKLVFTRHPELSSVGTIEEYIEYLNSIFPESVDRNIYWHGSDSDFSKGFESAERGEGSGAAHTKTRNDFYLAKQAWSVLQYVSGVNRDSVDKNGFGHWNKLWWELKEIMSNGRRENNDWKDIVIGEDTVRQAIPNKRGEFNRDQGGSNGKWLEERKADYGYENRSDKDFFEEILGIKWGEDTFNTWTQRNAEIFKQLESTQPGIVPVIINTKNPIRESGQNTYYEEQRGLFTQAEKDGNDAILGASTDNEFNSDIAVVLNASSDNVHFLGTAADLERFNNWKHQRAALTIAPTSATATKAKEIGGIDTLRHPDENGMHFGNPFSYTAYRGVQKVVPTVKDSAIAYEQWLRGEAHQEIEPERRKWILEQIRTGVLKGKPLVYYTEIIPDDSYGTDKYNAETAPNHAHILQKLIYDEDFIYELNFQNDQELSQTLGDEEIAREEIASVVQTVDKGISFSEALKGVESVFTPEEIALIQSGLNGDKLKVKSVSRQTDPAFFSKEIIKMLEENSKLPLDHPNRINVIEIWSKHDGEPIQDILQACKKYKVAPMVSFSITGLGDTALEKGVLKYQDLIPLIGQLIEQGDLNPLTTTIRIDPILVGETDMADIANIVEMCKELGIKKFVTSLVQSYGSMVGRFSRRIYDTPTKYHDEYRYDLVVQEDGTITDVDGNPMPGWYSNDRYVIKGIDEALSSAGRTYDWEYYYGTKIHNGRKIVNFVPKKEHIEEIGKVLLELNQDPEIEIETCSFHIKGLNASACLDPLIIERITGISVKNENGTYQRDTSRPDCKCYGAHSDMFRVNEKKCFSSCAYCYAGHSNDNNFRYYNLDGTLIDHSLSRVRKNELDSTQQVENKKELPLQVSEANFENYKSIVKNSILTIPGLKSMRALKVLFEANSFNEFMRQIEENEIRPDVKGNRLNSLKSLLDSTEIDEGTKQIVKELIEFEQMLLDSDTNPDRCQLTTKIKMQ